MLRIMGIILLISCGALFGIYTAHRLKYRVEFLEDYILLINEVQTQIRYTGTPLNELFFSIHCKNEVLALVNALRDEINDGTVFHTAWNKAVNSIDSTKGISSTDKAILCEFGRGLGTSDIEGQISHCELATISAKKQLQDAYTQKDTKTKLYKTLGTLAGIAAALLLI